MRYADLEKTQQLLAEDYLRETFIAQYKPELGIELNLTGEATNVPLLKKVKPGGGKDMPHCEIRAVIFDAASKTYLSSFYSIPAAAQPKKQQGNQAADPYASANWQYEENLKNMYVYSSKHSSNPNAALVFEFLIYAENSTALEEGRRCDKGNQVTVAWASVPLSSLGAAGKHELALKGGNPFNEQELETHEDAKQAGAKQSLLGRLKKQAGIKEKVLRSIRFTTKPFNKLEKVTQENLCSLTKAAIIPKNLLSFVVVYRKHCCERLKEPEAAMSVPVRDIVLSQFATAYNSPDVLIALAATWPLGPTGVST
jgi:hypothetical protein